MDSKDTLPEELPAMAKLDDPRALKEQADDLLRSTCLEDAVDAYSAALAALSSPSAACLPCDEGSPGPPRGEDPSTRSHNSNMRCTSIEQEPRSTVSSPDDLRYALLLNRAAALTRCGRYDDAVADARKARRLYPDRPFAYYRLSEAMFYAENYTAAREAAELGLANCKDSEHDVVQSSLDGLKMLRDAQEKSKLYEDTLIHIQKAWPPSRILEVEHPPAPTAFWLDLFRPREFWTHDGQMNVSQDHVMSHEADQSSASSGKRTGGLRQDDRAPTSPLTDQYRAQNTAIESPLQTSTQHTQEACTALGCRCLPSFIFHRRPRDNNANI